MAEQNSKQDAKLQRNKAITVIVLLILIAIAMVIGALGVAIGGPSVIFPENSFALPHHFVAAITQAGALL